MTVVYYLFPATFLFVEKRHASVLQIRPTGVETSRAVVFHFARTDGLQRLAGLDRNIGGFLQALDEDLAACESIQAGLRSGQDHLLFGRNENALHAFRDRLARRVADAAAAGRAGTAARAGADGAGRGRRREVTACLPPR